MKFSNILQQLSKFSNNAPLYLLLSGSKDVFVFYHSTLLSGEPLSGPLKDPYEVADLSDVISILAFLIEFDKTRLAIHTGDEKLGLQASLDNLLVLVTMFKMDDSCSFQKQAQRHYEKVMIISQNQAHVHQDVLLQNTCLSLMRPLEEWVGIENSGRYPAWVLQNAITLPQREYRKHAEQWSCQMINQVEELLRKMEPVPNYPESKGLELKTIRNLINIKEYACQKSLTLLARSGTFSHLQHFSHASRGASLISELVAEHQDSSNLPDNDSHQKINNEEGNIRDTQLEGLNLYTQDRLTRELDQPLDCRFSGFNALVTDQEASNNLIVHVISTILIKNNQCDKKFLIITFSNLRQKSILDHLQQWIKNKLKGLPELAIRKHQKGKQADPIQLDKDVQDNNVIVLQLEHAYTFMLHNKLRLEDFDFVFFDQVNMMSAHDHQYNLIMTKQLMQRQPDVASKSPIIIGILNLGFLKEVKPQEVQSRIKMYSNSLNAYFLAPSLKDLKIIENRLVWSLKNSGKSSFQLLSYQSQHHQQLTQLASDLLQQA